METRTALIAGATGLVGSSLLERLLADPLYRAVRALVRRPLDIGHEKLESAVVDFDALDIEAERLAADDVFCCLGTTIKKAGSQEAFRRVDHDYVEALARLAHGQGAERFLLVSSIGADAGSGNFYLSVKGAAEDAVAGLPYGELHVFRPGLLAGQRQESRPGERLAQAVLPWLKPVLAGPMRVYRAVPATTVAAAMLGAAKSGRRGRLVYMYDGIVQLAGAA